jgi:hypothetical protein
MLAIICFRDSPIIPHPGGSCDAMISGGCQDPWVIASAESNKICPPSDGELFLFDIKKSKKFKYIFPGDSVVCFGRGGPIPSFPFPEAEGDVLSPELSVWRKLLQILRPIQFVVFEQTMGF